MLWSSSPPAVKRARSPTSSLSSSYCVALVSWYSSTSTWPSRVCQRASTSGCSRSSLRGRVIRSSKSTLWYAVRRSSYLAITVAIARSLSPWACAKACWAFRPALFQALIAHCHERAVATSVVPPQSFKMDVMSSVSRMENWAFRPSTDPSSRSRRTPRAWKVQISTSLVALPTNWRARSRISAAALLVKVMAAIRRGSNPAWIKRPILWVITRVLPEPAPASTKQGPDRWLTASSCARLRPAVMSKKRWSPGGWGGCDNGRRVEHTLGDFSVFCTGAGRFWRGPAQVVAAGGHTGAERFCAVFCLARDVVPVWGLHPVGAAPGWCGAGCVPVLCARHGRSGCGCHVDTTCSVERCGIGGVGGCFSQHRLHGRAAVGGLVGAPERGHGDFAGGDRHGGNQLLVHRFVSAGPTGGRCLGGGQAGPARCGGQPHALGHFGRCGRVWHGGGVACARSENDRFAGRRRIARGALHHRRGAGAGPIAQQRIRVLVRCVALGFDETGSAPGVGLGRGHVGHPVGGATGALGPDDHGVGGGLAQREQRLFARRAFWGGQRAHCSCDHVVHRRGLLDLLCCGGLAGLSSQHQGIHVHGPTHQSLGFGVGAGGVQHRLPGGQKCLQGRA